MPIVNKQMNMIDKIDSNLPDSVNLFLFGRRIRFSFYVEKFCFVRMED